MPDTASVFVMEPVLEIVSCDDFALWPIASYEAYGFLPLSNRLTPDEVGLAAMRIVQCNDSDPDDDQPPRPAEPVAAFLHGLLTFDTLFAAGGLRVTDTTTGVTLVPGCCAGVEDWREWHQVLDGDQVYLGHSPTPTAERHGDTVRLTVDADQPDSPLIDLPADDLRRLLVGVERDLVGFHRLAADWMRRQLPEHAAPVTAALARVLDLH